MNEKSVSLKYRSVKIIRSVVMSALFAIFLCPVFNGIYVIIPVFAFLFSLLWIFYYIPKRGKTIRYCISNGNLILHRGVWFLRKDVIPLASIRYEERVITPLQRLLDVYDLVLYLPKGKIRLTCLDNTEEIQWMSSAK